MATVTAPQYVAKPTTMTMFLARRSDLRLVRIPRYPQFGQGGQKVGESTGEAVQFRDGRLDVPEKGKVTLDNGREADAGEIKEWLLRHPMLGSVEEGFWVVDPLAPPVSEDEMNRLLEAAIDEDVLREIIRQEEQGWDRPALLNPARAQLERVVEMKAEYEAEQAAKAAAEKKAN